MPPLRHLKPLLSLVLTLTLQAAQAQPAGTPGQLIDQLGPEIRQILEDPKSGRTPEQAERAVADQITALIRGTPGHLSLTAANERGDTPLMQAANHGYAQVVQALLADASVKLTVDVADEDGETAWMKASFARAITLGICQPGNLTRERYALLVPYLRRVAHLMKSSAGPYVDTLQALEAAGAERRTDAARQAWLAHCPHATPELRQSLEGAELMPALINAATARYVEFNKTARKAVRSIPAAPPQDMRFIRDSPKPRSSWRPLLLAGRPFLCPRMAKPEMPGFFNWRGEILFKVTAVTRAGVIEAADVDVLSFDGDRKKEAAEFFRHILLQTLAGYHCVGDFVFEQQFQFKFG